ncbi:MAG TPA: T9SS type A sorting domain-containing protein, partial [Saprospiraceae bacterium]|nr:T9SS type A sorting domain-containing protein [Saprospiraceae bacterium]
DSVYVTTPKVTLTGLDKKTDYDFYVLELCDSTTAATRVGPVSFQTYWSNDVGITGVLTPESSCDLGVETVKIVMKNFGAKPQSLVPFRFSVNGVDAGVPQPQDGFFTGVLGKDSSEVIEFETTYDFSAPGEYLITVYTQMAGDEDMTNDTFHYYIVNRLVAPYFQNFENWYGGWYVDTVNSVSSSWEFGTPDNTVISSAASGVNAWVTNLDGPYNPGELSFLTSPCFDFSDLTEDPAIQFSIIYSNFLDFDGAWLELSTNDGQSWQKVGAVGDGTNWYNNENINTNLGDVWSGESDGWKTARIRLTDMAGESNVRFRFAFSSFFFFGEEGVGVDDIRVYVPLANDLTGTSGSSQGNDNDCGLLNDKVVFTFTNFGTEPQSAFPVAYSINGAAPVVETVNATVQPDETFTYTFTAPFDSRDGSFDIVCWTNLASEQNQANDTVYYSISHLPKPVPFHENFESQEIPSDWTTTGFPFITNFNNNVSYVLELNMWAGNDGFIYDLPRYGVISAGDSLSFDYRMTDFGTGGQSPTTLAVGTKIELQVSTNCSTFQNLYSINILNHVPSVNLKTIKVSLGNYAGKSVKLRFKGTWTGGDFYFDLDNINLRACAADMQLTPTVVPSTNGQNGEATVNVGLGNPPYSYLWSTSDTTQTITGLAVGAYIVTVTDALGCTDELTVNVGTTAVQDIEGLMSLKLQPNPTSGFTSLYASFNRPVDANVEIMDLLGRRIWEMNASYTNNISEQLDLNNFPDGLYLVRLTVDGQTATRKLVKSR